MGFAPSGRETVTTDPLSRLLSEKNVLLADGGTGTSLFAMGLQPGEAPELWNETRQDDIKKLHRDFIDAGADIILTNSFGGNRYRLNLAGHRVHDLNRRAAALARDAADRAPRKVITAGSVGPTGKLLAPFGELTYADAVAAFVGQIEGLKTGGADVVWIETMSALDEIRAAAEAAAMVGLPYVHTGSFHLSGRATSAFRPSDMLTVTHDIGDGPVATGINCGIGPAENLSSLIDMTQEDKAKVIIIKSNCGPPERRGSRLDYPATPSLMADYARLARAAGARIIGGCCGTSCDHLAAMRDALDASPPEDRPTIDTIIRRIGPAAG